MHTTELQERKSNTEYVLTSAMALLYVSRFDPAAASGGASTRAAETCDIRDAALDLGPRRAAMRVLSSLSGWTRAATDTFLRAQRRVDATGGCKTAWPRARPSASSPHLPTWPALEPPAAGDWDRRLAISTRCPGQARDRLRHRHQVRIASRQGCRGAPQSSAGGGARALPST